MRPAGDHLGHGFSAARRRLYLEFAAPQPARGGFEEILLVVNQQDVAGLFPLAFPLFP